jgi:signal transduction histidine kinase
VEQDPDLRHLLYDILSERWLVTTAADGFSALSTARRSVPDLLFTDLVIPGLDGITLARAVREIEPWHSMSVAVLTSDLPSTSIVQGQEMPVDAWVTKPFDPDQVVGQVAGLLERQSRLAGAQPARTAADLPTELVCALFDQAPMPLALLRGSDYVVAIANEAACQAWNRSSSEVIGRSLSEVAPVMGDVPWRGLLDRVRETGVAYLGKDNKESGGRSGAGEAKYVDFVYAPFKVDDGTIEGVIVMGFDVTEEILVRKALAQSREEALAATRAKNQFVAMLAHELRSPLTPILAALDLIGLREGSSHEHDVIRRQTGRLLRLVDDILDMERVVQGKILMHKRPVELADVVSRALETSAALVGQRHQWVEVHVPNGLLLDADPDRLAQVVDNLVTNAAKYSDEGSRIIIEGLREGERIRLSVKDQGAGIAPEMTARVFEGFVQQSETMASSRGGLGLGLSIVRAIVEMHGGRVEARSDGLGCGSELIVELPSLSTGATPDRDNDTALTGQSTRRVLLVDPDDDSAEPVCLALTLLGQQVKHARNAATAFDAAGSFDPEIALIDVDLPAMDGYELAERIRESAIGRNVYLVALRRCGDEAARELAFASGFDREITKPVSVKDLARLFDAIAAEGRPLLNSSC